MKTKWTDYVLPGEVLATAKELNSQRDCIISAIKHLKEALHHHDDGNFADARWGVILAEQRLEDWKRSDKEVLAAAERFEKEMARRKRREKLIKELSEQGVNVVLIERRAN